MGQHHKPQIFNWLPWFRVKRYVVFGLIFLLIACPQKSASRLLPPLPQHPLVQVYFNQSPSSEYREPYRQQTRKGDNLEQIIIDTINQAQSHIDVAVQEFVLPGIAQALANKQKAGVRVRVIVENTYSRPWSNFTPEELPKLDERAQLVYKEMFQMADKNGDGQLSTTEINQGDSLIILQNARVPLINDTADGSKGSGLMHNKFLVVDDQFIIVTSANFTPSDMHGDFTQLDSRGNPNNLVKINNRKIANLFTQEFNFMWGDGPGGNLDSLFGKKKPDIPLQQFQIDDINISVKFSPSPSKTEWNLTANGAIGKVLAQAKQSINLALFVFSDQQLSHLLEKQNTTGITIKTLIEPNFAYRFYSSGVDMMGITLLDKCRHNPDNFPWSKPIDTVGVPNLPLGDRLHHKMAIIDQNIVITGSHNWTANANLNNDETLLIINSPTVAAHYQREFDRLYDTANLGIPSWLKTKVQQQQQACQRPAVPPSPVPNQAQINLNTATEKELETLPGIGPKTAQRIVEFRKKQRFTSLNDLEKVPGIGPKILEKLGDHVTW